MAAPSDRGVLKHLFRKVDRTVVEQALHREPLKSNGIERMRFLAGIVRLEASLPALLDYLEALAGAADRREAARAFSLTVRRVDFGAASNAQIARLVDLAMACFSDHDRVQAALGLISNASFRTALERSDERLSSTAGALFSELSAAERTVIRGQPLPEDEEGRERVGRGVDRLLLAPDPILRSYEDVVRERLAEHALDRDPLGAPVRTLIDSIPHAEARYATLGMAWAEKLLAGGHLERARAVLDQIAQSHPRLSLARARAAALSWPRLGGVTLRPDAGDAPLRRGFWLEGSAFVWVRCGRPEERAQLEREAELQARLTVPGVLPVLASGAGDDGTPYVVIAARGRPLEIDPDRQGLLDALDLARAGLALLKALALYGVELPDLAARRFSIEGRTGIQLCDFSGARSASSDQADVGHAVAAQAWFRETLARRTDLPRDLRALTARRVPAALLIGAIDRARARLSESEPQRR